MYYFSIYDLNIINILECQPTINVNAEELAKSLENASQKIGDSVVKTALRRNNF